MTTGAVLPAGNAAVSVGGSAVPLRVWLGYLAMVLGNFMAVLDIQIVASSINELQAGLSASADEIQWIQTSYLIAEVIAIPLSGYLSRLLSTRIYYTLSAAGFTLASVACAFSWNLGSMVVFRILQGFLGGGMIPTVFAALYILFPADKRVVPLIMTGMTTMLAPALGPTIGGYVTEALSWHWLFLLNLLPGMIVAVAVWELVDVDRPQPGMLARTDLWGLLFMSVFLGCFEYALDEGPRHDWLADRSVAICSALALVTGVAFFRRALTTDHPIVDLDAFRNRNFAVGSLIATAIGLSLYSLLYLTPMFLAQVRGYNPMQIGYIMMVQGVSMLATAPLIGPLLRRVDPRVLMGIGIGALFIGCWLNGYMTADWGFVQFAVPQIMRGFGFICCVAPMTNVALGTLSLDAVKDASGLFNVMRNIGGAIGLALITTLINERTWLHWQQLAESTRLTREPVRAALSGMGAMLQPSLGNDGEAGAIGMLARQAQLQAATMTFSDINLLLGAALLLTLPLLLLIDKVDMTAELEGAH
jgi:DHA2 family multidrug resistance protein